MSNPKKLLENLRNKLSDKTKNCLFVIGIILTFMTPFGALPALTLPFVTPWCTPVLVFLGLEALGIFLMVWLGREKL